MKIVLKAIILLSVILVLTTIPLASSSSVNGIVVTTLETTPQLVEPGNDVTVKIRISNEGVQTIDDFVVKLDANYPFYLKSESNNFNQKRTLSVGSSIDNTYYLIVDTDAKSGIYQLEFEIHVDDVILKPSDNNVYIKVVGKPDLTLKTNINSTLSPGETFPLQIEVQNVGTGIAKNIKIIPRSDDILMLGSNLKVIKNVEPNDNSSIECNFIVKDSLDPDSYKFPIDLEYLDEQGNYYSDSYYVGINVLNKADIGIQNIKIEPSQITPLDEIHIQGMVENTGKGDAKNVIVELISEDENHKSFIGQLKSDDDAPFYFDLSPESAGSKEFNINITYNDDFGPHRIDNTIEIEVNRPKTNIALILGFLALIAVSIVYYFGYMKKKEPENEQ
ncbi:COG1361 S-layer family protein [Methanococcoides burtonii]|uniref:CARDB domain-containing protein n=1 Tax=Methanococcoides burtonii (strain DSM 6242 / NBRC 107633 / OCM 468 / ACE-M) TaxID=259564 RepID=Q12XI4_METBU|nr:COG1361 S-layer family protein [Methanococcoides burtonii]ABE51842.1 Hypothetical protein Mbur_0894 [Methanococcoides burtonii DSM 6242]